MPTQLFIFDFDGVILDTESGELLAWQQVYREHGCELPMAQWYECVGRPHGHFDPYQTLAELSGKAIDRAAVRIRRRAKTALILDQTDIQPGVRHYIEQAQRRGIRLAIASSSTHDWVERHLENHGLRDAFELIICCEDTTTHKPLPEPYLAVLRRLNIPAHAAIAFEDSPNGVTAARAAGLFTIAIPNPVTRHMNIQGASLTINSLADLTLDALLATASSPPHLPTI